jgi:hypothetical protein
VVIGVGLDIATYAATLYSMLRAAENDGVDEVIALLPAGDGLAEAVRDRLTKAASPPPN